MQNLACLTRIFVMEEPMNTLRQTCAATVLSLLLAVSALAGQISSPGIVAPPPATGETDTLPGEITGPPAETEGAGILATVLLTIITWP